MKRSIAILITCVVAASAVAPSYAAPIKRSERFSNTVPLETITRSRTDAADAAAQVSGAGLVLLEALRWRGRSAKQLGLPAKLWCADFMAWVRSPFILYSKHRQAGTGGEGRGADAGACAAR